MLNILHFPNIYFPTVDFQVVY